MKPKLTLEIRAIVFQRLLTYTIHPWHQRRFIRVKLMPRQLSQFPYSKFTIKRYVIFHHLIFQKIFYLYHPHEPVVLARERAHRVALSRVI